MKPDAVRSAIADFKEAIEKTNTTSMEIYLKEDNSPINVGAESTCEVPFDKNVLIISDEDTIFYVDCDLINTIQIWK